MAGAAKDAAEHLASLEDGRAVWLDGARVENPTEHPAFRNAVRSAAGLYGYQADPANLEAMTFASPTAKRRVNRAWQMPTSLEELVQRRRALTAWAECHAGFMGRAPDHLASAVTGQIMGLEVFEAYDPARARAFHDYFVHARDNDLYLTYVIVNPQLDRSKSTGEQGRDSPMLRIVDEDAEGVTVRGGKMLGTAAILANEMFVAHLQPLKPDEEDYALSFAVPMAAKGLRLLARKSYEGRALSGFDDPLASRFDENDGLVWFDDVKVPWERVFVHRSPAMCARQFHATPGHIYQNYQAQIRLAVKFKFLVGLARRICETIGTAKMAPVAEILGLLAAQATAVETMLYGMEAKGSQRGRWFVPDAHSVYAAQTYCQALYPRMVEKVRGLAGGALIMLPSSERDLADPELARILQSVQQSADGAAPVERVRLMKLAWDALGSEFAGRQTQYEMFYAGAPFVTRGHSFRTFDWEGAEALVAAVSGSAAETRTERP